MKYLVLTLSLVSGLWVKMVGQPGLEGVLIERYYIADVNDASTPLFPVPTGATTYRVYVDLAPTWELQAIYGATNLNTGEVDSLIIRSTSPFFNNEDRGRAFGYLISSNNLDENTVALDSWFATGRSSNTTSGVVKPEDTNGGLPAFPNLDGLLQNNDPNAGIPISVNDGNIPFTSTATWTLIGITLADLAPFNDINLAGNQLVVSEGALTSFTTPLQGPTASNKVLIGQFTTAGTFSGKLNLQLRNSITGVVQQWVAESPTPTQFTSPTLQWKINDPPTVVITSPANNTRFLSGETVTVNAEAMDPDSAILKVEFFFDGVSVQTDMIAPFEATFTATHSGQITAVATGDGGGQAMSDPVFIEVVPYRVQHIEQFCNPESACIPVESFGQGISGIVGFDMTVSFDVNKIFPTGIIVNGNDLINRNYFQTDYTIDLINQRMQISVFLNGNAPFGSTFSGIGDIICIEFLKRPAFTAVDSTTIWITTMQETLAAGGVAQYDSIPPGLFRTIRNTAFSGSLSFWADSSPISYDPNQPSAYLVTTISATDLSCEAMPGMPLQPDLDGAFKHDLNNGYHLSINRDISGTTEVQSVINSFDAFLVRKVLKEDPVFIPDVFQMIAMDVNRDGVISAGDVSQINQRSVLMIDEFRQAWNYNLDGTPKPAYAPSKDWAFIGRNVLNYDPAYSRSTTYPADNGTGFSKFRVPIPPFCLWTEIDDQPDVCPEQGIETYFGILLGDVNGNYRLIEADGVLK